MNGTDRITTGKRGESCACRELRRRGYAIVATRYRTRIGELDIIARDRGTLVFVEVKARRGDRYGAPAEAVTWQKRAKLCAMAADYLHRHRLEGVPCRFDVVAVRLDIGKPPHIDVLVNAFDAGRG